MEVRSASDGRGGWPRVRLVFVAFVIVVLVTMMPFSFAEVVNRRFDWHLGLPHLWLDFLGNIALFAVFGYAIAGMAGGGRRRRSVEQWFVGTIVCGGVVSVAAEYLQRYLPRNPALLDIVANVLGTGIGAWCQLWPDRFPRVWWRRCLVALRQVATPRFVGQIALVVVTAELLFGVWAFGGPSLSSWDSTFGMAIGDELGGGRPFVGRVAAIEMSAGDVRGAYDENLEPAGGAPPFAVSPIGVPVAVPWAAWIDAARRSEAFALCVRVRSDESRQAGPARIVSIAEGAFARNLTLGQDGADLVVRVRSTIAGINGESPALRVRDVFLVPRRWREIRVEHRGAVSRIVVDGNPVAFRVTRFVAWLRQHQAVESWEVASLNVVGFGILVLPLVAVLGALLWSMRRRRRTPHVVS